MVGWKIAFFFLQLLFIPRFSQAQDYVLRLQYADTQSTADTLKFSFSDSLALHRFSDYLIDSLQAEGYLNLESNLQIKPDNRFFLQVDAGTQFKWIQLGKGNLEPWMESSLDGGAIIAGESPFRIEAVQHLMGQILETGQNNGYPFMAVKLDSIELDNGQLRASLYMEKGPLITFDTLRITGSSKIQPIYLARKTGIIPGNPFSQKKVNKLREVLKNSVPYLALSGSPEMSFQNEEATIYLPVEDRKMNAIDGIIGFLPNEIEANKWLVTGQFDLQLYNVSGKGRDYQLNWQRLTQYSQNLRVAAREPYVLGSQLDLGAAFSLLKEDTTFLNRDFSLRLGYQVTANTYIDFFSKWQAGDLLEVGRYENATELPEVGDFRYNSYGADFSFTDVDDPIVPKSGWRSKLTLGIGNKTLRENTGIDPALYAGIERESLQYYIRGAVDYYYRLDKNFSSRVSLQAGELNNSNLLLNDLYRLGGLQSIRGFNENFFYSSRYAYMNLEPRYYFGNYSYFLLFTDLGMLEDAVRKRERDWPFSFGAGLSLETAGGMFNFVYALGKSAGQPLGFNYSRIHFGFTGRF